MLTQWQNAAQRVRQKYCELLKDIKIDCTVWVKKRYLLPLKTKHSKAVLKFLQEIYKVGHVTGEI